MCSACRGSGRDSQYFAAATYAGISDAVVGGRRALAPTPAAKTDAATAATARTAQMRRLIDDFLLSIARRDACRRR
jgi:hypothetical protein